ncbi:hypothetical protein [Rhizobium sp. C4]|uniref:hypothetical protein n=1 Tax=Rhizobium sp. C4 TaxID=1349800 RepID=UPI001E5ECCA7|nr:hypothetical protein [Rhizobium sp. C4]MCD2175133.1 hypothetical protein [Rhizobium sp. C4]
MQQAFSQNEVAFLRRATDLASRMLCLRSQRDKAEIATYVLLAFQPKSADMDELARRAAQHFMLRRTAGPGCAQTIRNDANPNKPEHDRWPQGR